MGASAAQEPEPQRVFATWNGFEADKCASVWLIKRFIAPDAEIRFFSPDETPPPGILFDTPEARFRRYHNKSTYETLLDHYDLKDPVLVYIGRIIHDIEVNMWGRKLLGETPNVDAEVLELLDDLSDDDAVTTCTEYFDILYSNL